MSSPNIAVRKNDKGMIKLNARREKVLFDRSFRRKISVRIGTITTDRSNASIYAIAEENSLRFITASKINSMGVSMVTKTFFRPSGAHHTTSGIIRRNKYKYEYDRAAALK